jgi:excisionase family DNA binding protein
MTDNASDPTPTDESRATAPANDASAIPCGVVSLEPLLTIEELAAYLRVPVKTIYDWRYKRQGPVAMMIGRHLMWAPTDVLAWMNSRKSA